LLGAVAGVLVVIGAWWVIPALFAAPAVTKLHEIKTERSIDAEGDEKAKRIHEEGGLPAVGSRIMGILLGKSSDKEE